MCPCQTAEDAHPKVWKFKCFIDPFTMACAGGLKERVIGEPYKMFTLSEKSKKLAVLSNHISDYVFFITDKVPYNVLIMH